MREWHVLLVAFLVLPACRPESAELTQGISRAIEVPSILASAHGFPAMRDLDGNTLADGDFTRWVEDGKLHMNILFAFADGRRIEENTVFRQASEQLVQDSWEWRETRGGQVVRRFAVDFPAGTAEAETHGDDDQGGWFEDIDVEPSRTFAGFGFTVALKALRERLVAGETVELDAVGFSHLRLPSSFARKAPWPNRTTRSSVSICCLDPGAVRLNR